MGRRALTWARLALALAIVFAVTLASSPGLRRADAARVTAVPTPGPGAMSIYTVTNPGSTTLSVEHVFSNTGGFSYTFWSQVPAGGSATYHVRDIPQIPSPFQGTLNLYGDRSFSAQIVGYDYPSSGNNNQLGSTTPRVWLPVVAR